MAEFSCRDSSVGRLTDVFGLTESEADLCL